MSETVHGTMGFVLACEANANLRLTYLQGAFVHGLNKCLSIKESQKATEDEAFWGCACASGDEGN